MRWCALLCMLVPARARAWTETTPVSAVARVVVVGERSVVAYRIVFDVQAGRFRGFTLEGLPEGAIIDAAACRAIDHNGDVIPLRVRKGTGHQKGLFWIDVGDEGVGRGQLIAELAWTSNADVEHTEEGEIYRWRSPPWSHGLGMVSASLDLPFPRSRVQALGRDDGGEESTGTDSMEIAEVAPERTRITVSRFRLPRWSSLEIAARIQVAAQPSVPGHQPARRRTLAERYVGAATGIVACLFALLTLWKRWATRTMAARSGAVVVDSLLPGLGRWTRLLVGTCLVGGGAHLQLKGEGLAALGALMIVTAGLFQARRYDRAVSVLPTGRWVELEAGTLLELARLEREWRRRLAGLLDATCTRGFVLFGVVIAVVAWTAGRLPSDEARLSLLGLIDTFAVLSPLWLTGTRHHLPADSGALAVRLLRRYGRKLTRALRRAGGGEVSLLGLKTELPSANGYREVRLVLYPSRAPDGLVSIEAGVEVTGRAGRLGVLVRCMTASPAHETLKSAMRPLGPDRLHSGDGAQTVFILRPGPNGHAGLLADVRHTLRALSRASPGEAPMVPRAPRKAA